MRVVHALYRTGLSEEEIKRYNDLFHKIDINRDGKIDINDLTKALQKFQVPLVPGHAQVLLRHNFTVKMVKITLLTSEITDNVV